MTKVNKITPQIVEAFDSQDSSIQYLIHYLNY